MEYTEDQMLIAIERAKYRISLRDNETIYGYNCCWSFLGEYDKALRGSHSPLIDLQLKFDSPEGFTTAIQKAGFKDFRALADAHNFKEILNKRPMIGDVAHCILANGASSILIAGKSRWLTSVGYKGVRHLHQWSFLDRSLPLLIRPQRS